MLEAAQEYVRNFPESGLAYEQRGRAFYWSKRCDEALFDCDKAIDLDPESGIRWALRAEVKRELGDMAGARKDIEEAMRLEPDEEQWKEIELTII